MVVVHSSVDGSKLPGINIKLKTKSDKYDQKTDHNGVAYFTLDYAEKVQLSIKEEGWEPVKKSKTLDPSSTNVMHIKLLKQVCFCLIFAASFLK